MLLVLGMHRGGTSALARAANLLGAGLPRTLMPPGPDNPGGFWESSAIVAFNDSLLAAGGSSWRDWRGFTPAQLAQPLRDELPARIARLVAGEFGDHPLPVLKDPRLCRMLGLWLPALDATGQRARALLALRHPGAAIRSLCRRDAVSAAHAALLWLRHMLDAERATRGMRRAVISYNAQLAGGLETVRRAGEAIGIAWGPTREDAAFPDRRAPDDETLPALGSAYGEVWLRHAWQGLRALEAGDPGGMQTLDRVRAQFEDGCALFAPAVSTRGRPARPDLRDVTLLAADSARLPLTLRAIARSQALCAFGETALFTHEAPADGPPVVSIAKLDSRDAYSALLIKGLRAHVRTSHALIVQWDGYVVDPACWDERFLDYDYIGARWAWHEAGGDVGNGGFSLRSQRLLAALGDPAFAPVPGIAEDELICRVWRPKLERDFGMMFAPAALADAFSHERSLPRRPTFGFHGLFNLWRHEDDEAIAAFAPLLPPDVVSGREFAELISLCFAQGRRDAVLALGAVAAPGALDARLRALLGDAQAQACLRIMAADLRR